MIKKAKKKKEKKDISPSYLIDCELFLDLLPKRVH